MKKKFTVRFLLSFIITLTANFSFAQPLNGGTYTIDPALPTGGANFQKFNEVATRINTFGILGAVTFNVKQGIYNDSLELTDVIGSSLVNTITFRSNPTNTSPVILRGNGNTTTTATVKLTDTKYVSFVNLTLETVSTGTYTRVVLFDGVMANVRFKRCVFNGATAASASTLKSVMYGSGVTFTGSGLEVDSCVTNGGSAVAYITGTTGTRTTNMTFSNNTFNEYSYYGLYTSYIDNFTVRNNKFLSNIVTGITYTIYSSNATSSAGTRALITDNNINVNATSTFYGIYLTYFNSLPGSNSLIANNFMLNRSANTTATRYAIYLTANNNIDVLHNTVKILDGSTTASRVLYLVSGSPTAYTPGNYRIHNNILINEASSTSTTAGSLVYGTATAWAYVTAISNNIWLAPNAAYPYYNGTSFSNFPSWSTAVNDTNSYYGDPQFVSPTDLHVAGILASNKGLNFASVTTDIDGDIRPFAPSTRVDIGADEFATPACAKPASLAVVGADTNYITLNWLSGPGATSWLMEYGLSGFTPGTGTVVSTPVNPGTIVGLTPKRFYDIYVRSICGTDTSDMEGPLEANTYNQGVYFEVENSCLPTGFFDISSGGTQDQLLSDGRTGFPLPFPILLQGEKISEITISNNGVILFNTINGVISSANANTIATSALPGLYPFWDDLDDAGGIVYWQTIGNAPNRKFIVQWNKKHDFYQTGLPFIFQAVFDEKTMDIYYQYQQVVTGSLSYDYGRSATIGLVGPTTRVPLSYLNESYLQSNSCVRFFHTNCSKVSNLIIDYLQPDNAQFSWLAGQSGAASYTVIYGPSGFDPLTGGTTLTTTDQYIILPGLSERTSYDIYVYADCSSTSQSLGTKISVTTPPYCANPGSIQIQSAVDSLFSSWSWVANAGYNLTGFEAIYSWRNFDTTVTGYNSVTLDTSFTDTLFNPAFVAGGVYDYYLRAKCGNLTSDFIGPFAFKMPMTNDNICSAETLLVNGQTLHLDNTGATIQSGEAAIAPPLTGSNRTDGWGNNDLNVTTWFKFIAPPSGQIRLNCTARPYNGQMAVYNGNCIDFSTLNFIAGNDDDVDGQSSAPNFTICNLTPGSEYFILHDGFTAATGIYSINLSEIVLNAGASAGVYDACEGEMVNLNNHIVNNTPGGTWLDLSSSFQLVNDSVFNTTGLLPSTFYFGYELEDGCASDSAIATITVHSKNYAGTGQTVSICKNQYFNLFQGLTGVVDHGGVWKDGNGQTIPNGEIKFGQISLPGTYTFTYQVNNGFCPASTSTVQVTVMSNCDGLSLEEKDMYSFEVYPNPTGGWVYFDFNKVTLIDPFVNVFDANGRLVLSHDQVIDQVSQGRLNLSDLENGVYFVQIKTANTLNRIRVIKQ